MSKKHKSHKGSSCGCDDCCGELEAIGRNLDNNINGGFAAAQAQTSVQTTLMVGGFKDVQIATLQSQLLNTQNFAAARLDAQSNWANLHEQAVLNQASISAQIAACCCELKALITAGVVTSNAQFAAVNATLAILVAAIPPG